MRCSIHTVWLTLTLTLTLMFVLDCIVNASRLFWVLPSICWIKFYKSQISDFSPINSIKCPFWGQILKINTHNTLIFNKLNEKASPAFAPKDTIKSLKGSFFCAWNLVLTCHSRARDSGSLKVNPLQCTSTNRYWYKWWYSKFVNAVTSREGISMALKDIEVGTAMPADKQYKLTDGNGMHLFVHPNGSKYGLTPRP